MHDEIHTDQDINEATAALGRIEDILDRIATVLENQLLTPQQLSALRSPFTDRGEPR